MESKIHIFQNENKTIDLSVLIDSRMILCANSGAGKSYFVRKILEESSGKVMCIILDIEGEFKTLREKYDFLLIGDNADVPLNTRAVHLLPKKLLELNVSTIIDISDLKKHDRVMYVKNFLESLMELPREYWKPCLIVLDEIHTLAGQQEKQESTYSVIDLATRGRKRGFALIGVTQRISKLHKDVVAELNNYAVGRTSLDIDMKRSADILGFSTKQDELSLRNLDDGEFYVFGPAISKTIEKEKVSKSQTTHPKQGMDIRSQISKPTDNIKKILTKLSDLPKEIEQEKKDKDSLIKKVNELNKKIRLLETNRPTINPEQLENVKEKSYNEGVIATERKYQTYIKPIEQNLNNIKVNLSKIVKDANNLLNSKSFSIVGDIPKEPVKFKRIETKSHFVKPETINKPTQSEYTYTNDFKLKAGAIRMLKAVAMFNSLSREKTKTLAGISNPTTFSTYIQDLKRCNYITEENRILNITSEGINFVGEVPELPTDTNSLVNMWSKFIKSGAIRMLNICVDRFPDSISREELRIESDIENPTTFSTYIQDLKRNGLIEINGGEITASKELFEL